MPQRRFNGRQGARRRRREAARGTPAGALPAGRGVRGAFEDACDGVRVRALPAMRGVRIGFEDAWAGVRVVARPAVRGVREAPEDACAGVRARALPVGVAGGAPAVRRRRGKPGVCRAGSRPDCNASSAFGSGRARHSTSSLPICWTGAQSSACAMRPSIDSRCRRSSLKTRTLINSCAVSATSISCRTESVKPC